MSRRWSWKRLERVLRATSRLLELSDSFFRWDCSYVGLVDHDAIEPSVQCREGVV